jgi:tRNA(Arg) A34 adenosine deaminase TadA
MDTTDGHFPEPLLEALPRLMRAAVDRAARGDQPFGCVLADFATGELRGEAANSTATDPTAHAEVNALRLMAADRLDPRTVVLVSTAEPCPMCASACYWAKVRGVVYGTSIADLLRFGWGQIDLAMRDLLAHARPPGPLLVLGGYGTEWTDDLYRPGPRGGPAGA